ncbi:MAG TPA: type II secretion system F family protein [Acidobacteriaceae bacterium]|nr:type II secretion system F family protein [Acidobacteriaceae bacterium]
MVIAITTFIAIFLLIGSAGLILFYREAMLQRIAAVTSQRRKPKGFAGAIQQTGLSLTTMVEQFERVMPKSKEEASVVQQRLIRAGYRNESAIKVFYGAKILTPLFLVLVLLISGLGHYNPFFMYACALGLGYLGPDFWLGRRIAERQRRIRRGLPDVLDLLVICIEAGLSLDQGVSRTAQELRAAQPEISDELGVVVLEQAAGRPRADAWKNLADRTDVDSIRNLVSVLVQAEKFGTSIARTLRVHSDTLRIQRRQKVEEQAAKTTVKLVFPLVFFIFPSIFLVTLGPAAIIMVEGFQKYFK